MGDSLELFLGVCIDHKIDEKKPEKRYVIYEYKGGGTPYKTLAEVAEAVCRRLYIGADDCGRTIYDSVVLHTGSGLGAVPHGPVLIAHRHTNVQVNGPDSESISDLSIVQSKLVKLIREANKKILPYVV